MPFGLTYAEFVMGVGLSMFFGSADVAPQQQQWTATLGTATVGAGDPFDENFLTLTHRRDGVVWGKFTPIYGIGLSDQGTGFVSAGLGRPAEPASSRPNIDQSTEPSEAWPAPATSVSGTA